MHKDFSFEDLNFKQETTEHLLYSMIEVLHDAGFRVTTQRKIILEAIAQQVGWHVHPKDVFSYVQKKDDTIGLATVYRTLKMLEDMDLLNKVYMMGQQNALSLIDKLDAEFGQMFGQLMEQVFI